MSDSLAGLAINVDVSKVKAAIEALDALALKAGEVEKKVSKVGVGSNNQVNNRVIQEEKRVTNEIEKINKQNVNARRIAAEQVIAIERAKMNATSQHFTAMDLAENRRLVKWQDFQNKINKGLDSEVAARTRHAVNIGRINNNLSKYTDAYYKKQDDQRKRDSANADKELALETRRQVSLERAIQASQTRLAGITGRANRQLSPSEASSVSLTAINAAKAYEQVLRSTGMGSLAASRAQGEFNRAMQQASGEIARQGGLLKTLNTNASTLNSAFGGAGLSVSGFGRAIFQTSAAIASLTGAFAIREIAQSIMEFERFSNTLRTVSGSSVEFQRNMTFLFAEADRIGFSVSSVGNSFARLSIAMQGAGFTGTQTRESFTQLTEASRNFGLSSADTMGVIRALEQSMSKGKFMAEEVRLQLGDRLPVAMAALERAVTKVDGRQSDINKRFEEGTLDVQRYGAEFIRQINLMSGGSSTLERTSQTMAAAFGRLGTEFTRFTNALGEGGFTQGIIAFTDQLRQLMVSAREVGALQTLGEGFLILANNTNLALGALAGLATFFAGSALIRGLMAIGPSLMSISGIASVLFTPLAALRVAMVALVGIGAAIGSSVGAADSAVRQLNQSVDRFSRANEQVRTQIQNIRQSVQEGINPERVQNDFDRLVAGLQRTGLTASQAIESAVNQSVENLQRQIRGMENELKSAEEAYQRFINLSTNLPSAEQNIGRILNRNEVNSIRTTPEYDAIIAQFREIVSEIRKGEQPIDQISAQLRALQGSAREVGRDLPESMRPLRTDMVVITRLIETLINGLGDLKSNTAFSEQATKVSQLRDRLTEAKNELNGLQSAGGALGLQYPPEGGSLSPPITPRGNPQLLTGNPNLPAGAPNRNPLDLSALTDRGDRAVGAERELRDRLTRAGLIGPQGFLGAAPDRAAMLNFLQNPPPVVNGGQRQALSEAYSNYNRMLRGSAGAGGSVGESVRDLNLQADKAGNDPGAASAYADAIRRVTDAATNAQGSVSALAAIEDARAAVTRRLTREMDLAIRTMDREIANNGRLANAYAQSNAAGREMEIAIRAETEARKYALAEGERTVEQIAKYEEAVARLTEKIRDLDTSEKNVAISRQLSTGRNDLEVLEREGQLITANVSTRNAEIAVLRARQQYAGADEAFLSRLETQIRQTEELRTRNEQLTNSWTEVSRLGEQAFERIGSAITEAFAQGKLDGLNFKNVMKAVFSEVAQAALKLAIINPILNAAFGGTRGTIGGVFGALGAGGVSGIAGLSGGVAGGAPGTIVVNGMNYMAAGQQASQQASLFGLGRMTGLGTALGGGYANTGFASVNNVLNTSVWGNTPTGIILGAPEGATGAAASAANQLAGTSTFAPGSTGTSGLNVGGAIGGAAGIAGGAYGIYSGVQKGGLGGGFQVAGGATSAVMGALQLAGMSLGPPGWIAAAILSIAGALLPGAKPSGMGQTAYENVDTGAEGYAGLGGKRFSQGNLDNSKSAVGQIADLAREVGQRLGGAVFGSHVAVGTTNTKLYLDVAGRKAEFSNDETGSKDLAAKAGEFIIQQFREANRASGDYAKILNNSPDDITKLTENLDWYEKVFKTFGESITPVSEFQKSLDDLNAQFQVSIDKANSLGLSTDKINEAREKEIVKLNEQRDAQVKSFDQSLAIRRARNSGNNLGADIMEFDIAALAELDQKKIFLESLGLSVEDVAAKITETEVILNDERLAIYQKYADGIAASTDVIAASLEQLNSAREKASGSISSLVEYARSLSFGDFSTLTSQSKFDLALSQFNSTSTMAKQGDAKSISGLRSYAEQVLTSGRDMYGSGAGYASVFNSVLSTLAEVGSLSEDTLTASFMAQISETSTQTLVSELQALRVEVVGLRTQVAQQQSTPARA